MEYTEGDFRTRPAVRKNKGLVRLQNLLTQLDEISELRSQSPGIYQWRSGAFLHFHYHPNQEIVADVRVASAGFEDIDGGWYRVEVTKKAGQQALFKAILRHLRGN